MKDFVIVILLNYDQNEYTLKCIDSLLKSDYLNFKILVVDNGSTPNNANDLIKKLPKNQHIIFKRLEENIGYSQGTNYGLKEGIKLNPDFFLIMNNDTIIDKNAMKELVKTCKDYNKEALVTGKVYHYEEPDKLQLVGYKDINRKLLTFRRLGSGELDIGQYDRVEERDMIDDIFVLHPVKLYKSVGGYTPHLWINGVNIDLALRAINKGFKLVFTPNAKLYHKGSVTMGGRNMNPKLAYWTIESSLILRYLHLNKIDFSLYYLITVEGIARTYFKSLYLKLVKGEDIIKYAEAKFKGLISFHNWIKNKNHSTGFNPF